MLQAQETDELKHYAHIRKVLDKSMVLGESKNAKYQQGYVTVQRKNGKWKNQYIILSNKYIIGHRLKDKVSILTKKKKITLIIL